MADEHTPHDPHSTREQIELPCPTAWPMVLALGLTLSAAGLVTYWAVSVAGVMIVLVAATGWAHEVFTPAGEMHVDLVPLSERAQPPRTAARRVESLRPGMPGHRMRIPEKIHPYSAGAKGGLAGAVTMAVVASTYGLISGRGIWYPINLLAGMILPGLSDASLAQLQQFNATSLLAAIFIHLVTSVVVGLMFGVILPTLPRWPVLWGGIVAPVLWTGGLHAFMGVLNPVMEEAVDWPWFLVSQVVYGLTVGIVVVRSEKVYVSQGGPS